MTGWQILNLFLFLICYTGFSWSICRHFKQPAKKGLGMQLITGLGSFFILVHAVCLIFFYRGGILQSFFGAVFYGAAILLFWSAIKATASRPLLLAYSAEGPGHLLTSGPYSRIRHPFYTSYLLAWLAGMIASGQPILIFSVGVMFSLYYKSARREEKQFAEGPLAQEYQTYRSRTGMFFPKLIIRG